MVNPEIDQDAEKWGRKQSMVTVAGTEMEQTWITSHRVPGLEPGIMDGSRFLYKPLRSCTGPSGGTEDCLRWQLDSLSGGTLTPWKGGCIVTWLEDRVTKREHFKLQREKRDHNTTN